MITQATPQDIPILTQLWADSFSDTAEGISLFMQQRFQPENALVYRSDDEILAALYLLECDLRTSDNTRYPAFYLYAAATSPLHRKRGYMAQLLARAAIYAAERGKAYIALVPASDALFSYYERHGYTPAFQRKQLRTSRRQLMLMQEAGGTTFPADVETICQLRNQVLQSSAALLWDANALDYALQYHQQYQGKSVFCANAGILEAYALFDDSSDDEKCLVTECICQPGSFPRLATLLLACSNKTVFTFHLPLHFPLSADVFDIEPVGMLHPLTDAAQAALPKFRDAYLGLALN